jgi:hypothetical protein
MRMGSMRDSRLLKNLRVFLARGARVTRKPVSTPMMFRASDCGRLGRQAAGHPWSALRVVKSCRKDCPTANVLLEAKAAAVRRRVFCNRKPGLRLDTARWEEDAELLVLLFRKKTTSIYVRSSCLPPCHLPCHLGPAQLDLSAILV